MNRLEIIGSIEDVSADEQREALITVVDYFESKFLEIRDLLENIDLDSLDNIIDAKNIAEDVSKALY